MGNKFIWAVNIRYLESDYEGDGKWHSKTTKWYETSDKAWDEAERFQKQNNCIIMESSSTLIHKEKKK